jgi:catechol 2,3-dioxygenase-like lactoylglutathione lyase family enzyme
MTSRIQLALNVRDVESATRFYADMFGVPPARQRPGYADFVVADPPLKLVLLENPGAATALHHLGVDVASTDDPLGASEFYAVVDKDPATDQPTRCCVPASSDDTPCCAGSEPEA